MPVHFNLDQADERIVCPHPPEAQNRTRFADHGCFWPVLPEIVRQDFDPAIEVGFVCSADIEQPKLQRPLSGLAQEPANDRFGGATLSSISTAAMVGFEPIADVRQAE